MFDQTIISDDIYIRLGRSGYVYISSVSQESMVPIAPSELPALSAFLVSYLAVAAPSNNGVQPTAELAGSESFVDKSKEERQTAAADA